jgi:hypothetical protein
MGKDPVKAYMGAPRKTKLSRSTSPRKKQTQDKVLDTRLQREFGITLAEYNQMLVQQNGGCAICNRLPGKRRVAVDHDHETGIVRGLLCTQCNQMLGLTRDSVTTLQSAIEYLSKRRTSQ